MAVKAKGTAASKLLKRHAPKRTRQGQGQHSKPNHGRKLSRGQGHG